MLETLLTDSVDEFISVVTQVIAKELSLKEIIVRVSMTRG